MIVSKGLSRSEINFSIMVTKWQIGAGKWAMVRFDCQYVVARFLLHYNSR